MKKEPLVSVIIPTRNSTSTLEACLKSIKNQTFKKIEVIVVDNNSTDNTKSIARKFTNLVFDKGPERSAQRNFGASKSKGEYLLFIDSDMELEEKVVEDCLNEINSNYNLRAIVIPEKSFGDGFWAECKALERSFYIGVDWIEAARFFERKIFLEMKGYDENITGPEDYDLPQRIKDKYGKGAICRIKEFINHNEGKLKLLSILRKKMYYGKDLSIYKKNNSRFLKLQANPIYRYKLFFNNPKKLLKNPALGLGMMLMKSLDFLFGAIGFLKSKLQSKKL